MLEQCFRRKYEVKIRCSRSSMSPGTCRAVTKRIWGVRVGFWGNLPVGILLLTSRVPTFLAGFCPTSDFAHTETFDAICVFVCFVTVWSEFSFLPLSMEWTKLISQEIPISWFVLGITQLSLGSEYDHKYLLLALKCNQFWYRTC